MDEHLVDFWRYHAGIRQWALQVVYHRLLDTMAEGWVAPNPRSSERCSMAQWGGGGLCEFILEMMT